MNHRLCTTVRRPGDKGLLNPLVHWTGPFFASFLRIPIPINRVGRHASQKIFREMHFRGAGAAATGFVDGQRSSHTQSSAGFCTSYRVAFKKSTASKYPSSKPHTLPSGSAPTRSPVLQKSCWRLQNLSPLSTYLPTPYSENFASGQRQLAERGAPN